MLLPRPSGVLQTHFHTSYCMSAMAGALTAALTAFPSLQAGKTDEADWCSADALLLKQLSCAELSDWECELYPIKLTLHRDRSIDIHITHNKHYDDARQITTSAVLLVIVWSSLQDFCRKRVYADGGRSERLNVFYNIHRQQDCKNVILTNIA